MDQESTVIREMGVNWSVKFHLTGYHNGFLGLFTRFSKSDSVLDLAEMFFGGAKSQRAKKYVDEVFDHFDVDNSGELSYEGNMS